MHLEQKKSKFNVFRCQSFKLCFFSNFFLFVHQQRKFRTRIFLTVDSKIRVFLRVEKKLYIYIL